MSIKKFYLWLPVIAVLAFGSVSFAQEFDREALKAELRAELKAEIKQELIAEVKSEILNETKADVQRATEEATLGLKDVMRSDFKAELRAEIMEETRGDISSEIEKALAGSSIMGGLFKGTTVGGFVDTMFSYNFRQHGEDTSENSGDIAGLNFIGENDDNTFTIESLAIFFDKEVTDEDPIGWQAHTYWGEKAKRITFLGEGAGRNDGTDAATPRSGTDDTARNDIFTLAVANISWNAPLLGKHVKLTMGKMYTWIGYELVENIGNPNYSHGINYNAAIPFTHMGLNADVSEFLPSDKLGLTLYYVNGWDSFIDNNESKSFGAYLTYTPNDDFFISLAGIIGNEGWNKRAGDSVDLNGDGAVDNLDNNFVSRNNGGATFMYDIVINYALPQVDKLSLGANWDWGQIEDFVAHDGDGDGRIDGLSTAQWWSVGLYAKYDYTDAQQGALRYEYFDDTDGARAFGYSIWDITYTQNMKVRENLMLRPEIRYIKHNAPDVLEPAHGDRDGGGTLNNDSEFIFTFGTEYVF